MPFQKIFLGLSAAGFLDAVYLTFKHYAENSAACLIDSGCNEVLSSHYGQFFGIPVGLIGAVYYFSLLFLITIFLLRGNPKILYLILPLTFVGFLISGYFVYLQLFIIKSICYYCMFSAAASTGLFILSLLLIIKHLFKSLK